VNEGVKTISGCIQYKYYQQGSYGWCLFHDLSISCCMILPPYYNVKMARDGFGEKMLQLKR